MEKPSYNIEAVYKDINTINGYFDVRDGGNVVHSKGPIHKYCPYYNTLGENYCFYYHQMATSGVINLVENLMKYDLDYDKLAEYAILFLSYKLNENPEYSVRKLNDIYTKNIEKNEYYNNKIKVNGLTCKEIINRKKNLMNMNINEISKFNEAFSILCKLYNGIINNKLDCTKYPSYPENFANKFKELNDDSNINGNNSYSKLLSTLSDDYNHLKNKYGNDKSCNFLPIPKVKTPPSKLIPVLSTFSVIPVFLGIAYKTIYKEKIKKSKEEIET
ncbi:PIR protein CIR protein [Plasmodium vinckei petteri]|uniref:PIR protein CIR protein n=1 Tax=Plasmodium vinckei petteri TaxID=138298 RepID=A0A6V7T9R3_PLAVN|nr:PIR protein CIR protein [Plasmodium vinckei petteri]